MLLQRTQGLAVLTEELVEQLPSSRVSKCPEDRIHTEQNR
jgi:hypothetical protein